MTASPGLHFLNIYTIIGATGFGLSVFIPDLLGALGWTVEATQIKEYNVWYNILGSLWLAVAATCFLGRNDPVRISGVFAVQMFYKSIWIVTTIIPKWLANELSAMNQFAAVVMLSYIILDVMYVPWSHLFSAQKQKT